MNGTKDRRAIVRVPSIMGENKSSPRVFVILLNPFILKLIDIVDVRGKFERNKILKTRVIY